MAVSKIMRARLRGQLVGCLLFVLLLGLMGLYLILALFLDPYLPYEWQGYAAPAALIMTWFTCMCAVFGLIPLASIRRDMWLDRAFSAHGQRRRLGLVARGWRQNVGGREFQAWFDHGPRLEIYLTCAARTRGGFTQATASSRLAHSIVGSSPFTLEDGVIYQGLDPAWMQTFAGDPDVAAAVAHLLKEDHRSARSIAILPDAVHWSADLLPVGSITEEAVSSWVRAITTLAQAIDRQPAPAEPIEATRLDIHARTYRIGCAARAAGLLVLVFSFACCAGGFMLFLASLT